MRKFILYTAAILLGLGLSENLQAQELDPDVYGNQLSSIRPNNNVLYAELGGSGFLLSLNYERKLFVADQLTVAARVGIGSAIFINALPLAGLNASIGARNGKLELGFNAIRTYSFDFFFAEGRYILANPLVGYRYEHPAGFLFRVTASPFFQLYDPEDWVDNDLVFPWLGLSFGYCF